MRLEDYSETLAHDAAFWYLGLTSNLKYPIDQLGKLSLDVSGKFRALAILMLLTQGESDLFFHNLIRSGLCRETYLLRLKKEGIKRDHHQASGRFDPFLDTVAACDFERARRISALSPRDWMKGHEYEDDYCYAQILHRFALEQVSELEISPLIERFERYMDGDYNLRLELCKALSARDGSAFADAFEALLDEREAGIEEAIERGQLEDPVVVAQRRVFVEGLALLRFAECRGIDTQLEYRYCPSLARVPMQTPFPGE
jgi:hypothetical protein